MKETEFDSGFADVYADLENYALAHSYTIVGESFDDNISGMHFDRDGIEKLCEAVEAGGVEAVIVKDLSRLGRHRTQTEVFIDYLRRNHVRVLSATEGIDTFNDNDDLLIGVKGLMNDLYARDGSRRVTANSVRKCRCWRTKLRSFCSCVSKRINNLAL